MATTVVTMKSLMDLCGAKLSYVELMWLEDYLPLEFIISAVRCNRIIEATKVCGKLKINSAVIYGVLCNLVNKTLVTESYHIRDKLGGRILRDISPIVASNTNRYDSNNKYIAFKFTVDCRFLGNGITFNGFTQIGIK